MLFPGETGWGGHRRLLNSAWRGGSGSGTERNVRPKQRTQTGTRPNPTCHTVYVRQRTTHSFYITDRRVHPLHPTLQNSDIKQAPTLRPPSKQNCPVSIDLTTLGAKPLTSHAPRVRMGPAPLPFPGTAPGNHGDSTDISIFPAGPGRGDSGYNIISQEQKQNPGI